MKKLNECGEVSCGIEGRRNEACGSNIGCDMTLSQIKAIEGCPLAPSGLSSLASMHLLMIGKSDLQGEDVPRPTATGTVEAWLYL